MSSIIDIGDSVVDEVIPGASVVTGAVKAVVKWIGIKGKTPLASWDQVRGLFVPYFDAIYQAYFSENYTYELANIDDGLPLGSKSRGIWVVGMFIKPKDKSTSTLVIWARYGTMENRIGNAGFSSYDAVGASKDAGKSLPDAGVLYENYKNRGFILNKKASPESYVKTDNIGIPEKEEKGIPVDVKVSMASFAPYVQYVVIAVVLLAMVSMFKKK